MEIRKMEAAHEAAVMDMMRAFYSSPAVLSNGSDTIFRADIAACVSDSPYLEGYVFAEGETLMGYAMVASTFNCEYGKECKWIEDLFILTPYRSRGIGSAFFAFIDEKYPDAMLRLEVEEENEGAVALYKRRGFRMMPYMQMVKNTGRSE